MISYFSNRIKFFRRHKRNPNCWSGQTTVVVQFSGVSQWKRTQASNASSVVDGNLWIAEWIDSVRSFAKDLEKYTRSLSQGATQYGERTGPLSTTVSLLWDASFSGRCTTRTWIVSVARRSGRRVWSIWIFDDKRCNESWCVWSATPDHCIGRGKKRTDCCWNDGAETKTR